MKAITQKQARERGILSSHTSRVTGRRNYQVDLCGERNFASAKEALSAWRERCRQLSRAAE